MTAGKMTVHEALSELKVLTSRITKAMQSTTFVYANKHANNKVSGIPIETYNAEIKSALQSVQDLIARRDALKRAVVQSNAVTEVVIAGKKYTVAEAIEIKNNGIPILQALLNKLDSDVRTARLTADRNNGGALEARADEYVKSLYGNANSKDISEDARKTRENFIETQTIDVVDPVNSTELMIQLADEINAFTVAVDSALSVSNATTEIEFEY